MRARLNGYLKIRSEKATRRVRQRMKRIPEEELMLDEEQARAYGKGEFEEPHSRFIERFRERFFSDSIEGHVLDLGCGPADISLRFARSYSRCRIHGVDGSEAMLKIGRQAIRRAQLEQSIELIHHLLPTPKLPRDRYEVVISNSLLHHLKDPQVLWNSIGRFAGPAAPVFVMDLRRPGSEAQARELTELYSSDEPEILQRDFYQSLLAAYREDEVLGQLEQAGLAHFSVEVVSDRHFIVCGRGEKR
jgi:ubiquinone/menaquinone biosynthesis C-methylase UbiE